MTEHDADAEARELDEKSEALALLGNQLTHTVIEALGALAWWCEFVDVEQPYREETPLSWGFQRVIRDIQRWADKNDIDYRSEG
jgi:hypothetical protein